MFGQKRAGQHFASFSVTAHKATEEEAAVVKMRIWNRCVRISVVMLFRQWPSQSAAWCCLINKEWGQTAQGSSSRFKTGSNFSVAFCIWVASFNFKCKLAHFLLIEKLKVWLGKEWGKLRKFMCSQETEERSHLCHCLSVFWTEMTAEDHVIKTACTVPDWSVCLLWEVRAVLSWGDSFP